MNKQNAANRIIELCQSEESFLVLLHSHNTFDNSKYQELLSSIYIYQRILGDDPEIDRNVAGCLFAFVEALENAFRNTDQTETSRKSLLADAHAEAWDLVQELFSR